MAEESQETSSRKDDRRELEPQLVGDHLVNVYSKALMPRRRTVCTTCVLKLKRTFKPMEFRGRTYNPIDRLRVFWCTREQRIIRSGTCHGCGKVYDEQALRPGTVIAEA